MEHKKFTWKHYTLIAVGIVFVIYCCIAVYFSKKFTYGTKINGVDVSNKTVDEVTDIFKKKADGYSLTVKERKGREEVLKSSDITIVDFWATWCGPCKMFSPIIDEIAEENHPGLKVGKVNVDEQPDLAGQYRVMSIPTLLVFKGGKVVANSVGVQSKKAVLDMVEKAR